MGSDVRAPTANIERVAVLWQAMSGYFDACLKALASANVEVSLAYEAAAKLAPFDDSQFGWVADQYRWRETPDVAEVRRLVAESRPDAILVSSWHIPAYRKVLRELRSRGILRVLCMDNQWRGRPKQWVGRLTWRSYIRPCFDLAFVPGDRQAHFARLLGFRRQHVMRGLYCADTDAFTRRPDWPNDDCDAFLFIGRLAREKGVEILAQAYALYRTAASDPWPLRVVGTGPELGRLKEISGVEILGFRQPRDIPYAMWNSSTLVCPSLFEPWGVVVHEATAAGLIVICSDAVGAGVHLVQDGYNGFVVPTHSVSELATALAAVSSMSPERRHRMSTASASLSRQFTPDRWARYVVEMLAWNTGERTRRSNHVFRSAP